MTKAQLEKEIYRLEDSNAALRDYIVRLEADKDLLTRKFIELERIVTTIPTEVPRRSSGETYDYIDSRRHLMEELKAAMI